MEPPSMAQADISRYIPFFRTFKKFLVGWSDVLLYITQINHLQGTSTVDSID